MNFERALKIGLSAVFALTVVACSSNKAGSGNGAAGAYSPQSGVQSMGLGPNDTIAGLNTASSPFRMKAPYNQIYFFDYDRSDIHGDDLGSIDVQGNYLATHPNARILLTGNTDERGSREYNIALGERRALSVASRLKMDGAKDNQVRVVSYGAEKPIIRGNGEESFAQNRNVQLIYEAK